MRSSNHLNLKFERPFLIILSLKKYWINVHSLKIKPGIVQQKLQVWSLMWEVNTSKLNIHFEDIIHTVTILKLLLFLFVFFKLKANNEIAC